MGICSQKCVKSSSPHFFFISLALDLWGRFILTPLQSFTQPSSPGHSPPFLWAWCQQVGAASSLTPTPPGSCLQLSPAGHPPEIFSHFHHSAPDLLLFLSSMPLVSKSVLFPSRTFVGLPFLLPGLWRPPKLPHVRSLAGTLPFRVPLWT